MPTQPGNSSSLVQSVVDLLACPACLGSLRVEVTHLVCTACRRAYPILDGIPVLIVERAELLAASDSGQDH